jgi:hypothetical protein
VTLRVISTVVTPANSYDLTTLAVVKDELSITSGDSDPTLQRYLGWASAALSQACNQVFPVETVKDEVWPDARMDILQLSRFPLTSVTSIVEGGNALVADTDFRADMAGGSVLRLDGSNNLRCWPACPIVATFAAGFATIPGDIADAVTRMVRNRFRAKGRDTYLISENIPGVRDARWWIATGNEAGNMPPDIADLVENYRVPVIA